MTHLTFRQCCEAVVANQEERSLNYAVNYAKYGLTISDPHEAKIQALYILNNMTRWRGEQAKQVRISLKKIGGDKNV